MKTKIYLSKQGYDKKPDSSAGIIKTINSYDLVDISIDDLYRKLANGHFVHHECGFSQSQTGGRCYTFKKHMLKQAQIMCIDFDYKIREVKKTGEVVEKHYEPNEMPEWTPELLSNLKYKNPDGSEIDVSPTFWMESFSAHKNTETKVCGNNIHLFYAFEDPICSTSDYEKVAITVIYAIYNALKAHGYDIPLERERCPIDPVSTDMFQGLWGSSGKKHHFNGTTYFWDDFIRSYKPEMKDFIFQVKSVISEEATEEEIRRTVESYSTVKELEDIDIEKCQYLKYKGYFGHEEGFHIMSVLKHEYAFIEEGVNSNQSLCYQVCRKLLLGHCNDFFDNDEDKFYREYRRCKAYNKKGTNEAAYMSHVIRLIGDTGALPLINYKPAEEFVGNVVRLSKSEYLSDKKSEIISMMQPDKINFLIAKPGLGKTVFAKNLDGRTLIIELFNSIIQSEEKFSSQEFHKFFGDNYIKTNNVGKMNVCSTNKFVSWYKSEDVDRDGGMYFGDECLFDNIILDESHLLCLSNYRYDIMGETVQYIKKLKADYPKTNVILMTGTPFGEDFIFDNLNTIKIVSEKRYKKSFHMVQTSSIEGYMRELIKDTLTRGLRVFIPVDSENWFDTFIDSCIEDGITTRRDCYYFNQPKSTEDLEKYILNTKLIGDIKILGTSSYMSVGIDLEDWKTKFVTIIPSGASATGNFSGIQVEQFANRHRKQDLEVHYVISKNEQNTVKPTITTSCRALLNIKNSLLKSMYRTNPIVIKVPQYMINENEELSVNEDMFNVFVYYRDMLPIISHPKYIYEYMQGIGWECDWYTVDNTHRGIDTKEHREAEKAHAVDEFMKLLDAWEECGYPSISVRDSIQQEFEIVRHHAGGSLFDVDSIEVGFTSYYSKNALFGMLLHLREWLTGRGALKVIRDNYSNDKINMSGIEHTLTAIRITNTCIQAGVWKEMSQKLRDFYDKYSTAETGITKDNKKEFEAAKDEMLQSVWDDLASRVEDETMQLALASNYGGVTEHIISDFMDGAKLILTMYLEKESIMRKVKRKMVRVSVYHWKHNALSKYELRPDKRNLKKS